MFNENTPQDAPDLNLQTPFENRLDSVIAEPTKLQVPSYTPELGEWHAAFQDKENNGGKTPSAIPASKIDDNPQDFRDLSININGLAYLTGKPSEEIGQNYDQFKQQYVKENNWDMPKTEGEFRGMLGRQVETMANQSEALKAAQDQAVADDMEDASNGQSLPLLARYAQWNTQHAGSFVGVPEATKMAAFTQYYGQARANLASPYNDLAKQIVDTFQNEQASKDLESKSKEAQGQAQRLANTALNTLGATGDVFGDGSTTTAKDAGMPESHQDIVNKINAIHHQDLPKLKALIDQYSRYNEKLNGDNKSSKYVVYKLAQTIERTAENMAIGTGRVLSTAALNAQLATETDPAKIDAIKKKISLKRSGAYLRSLVHSTVNPVQNQDNAVGAAEGIVQGIGTAIPYIASFGLGVGAGSALMVSSSMADVQERIAFNNPEISDDALNLATAAIGVPVGMLQLLGLGTVARAFPATEALFKTLPLDHPILNAFLHGGAATTALTASNAVESIGMKVAHALDSDFNDVELAKELFHTFVHAPATFVVMMAMGGMGHGKLSPEESDKLRASLKDPVSLKIAGIDPSKMAGVSDAELPSAYRDAFKGRDAKAGAEFRTKVEELAKNAQNDPTIPQYKMDENGNHIITVLDPINGNIHELLNTTDPEQASDAHQAAFAMWRMNILRHTFMTQDMQQRADKAAGIENRSYEFSLGYHLGLSLDAFKNGTAQEILRNRMQIADMPESSPLTDALVAGWSSTRPLSADLVRDVNQYVSTIHNADFNPETQIHERADDWTARVLDSGKATVDQFKDWLTQTEQAVSARSGQEVTFLKNKENPTRTDIIEGVTEAALHLFGGHTADFASYPPELRGYFAAMGEYFKGVTEMGEHVKASVDAGEVPKDFAEHLATALGLPAEDRLAPKSAETLAETANPHLEAAGQPTFSLKPKNESSDPYKRRDGEDAGSPLTKTEIQEGIEDESGTLAEPEIDDSKWDELTDKGTTFSIKPKEGDIPTISAKDLKGKKKFIYFSDRMRVGTYTGLDPESGINIPLQGGPSYPFTEGNIEKGAGWAFTVKEMWKRFQKRIDTTDGIGLPALYASGNVRANHTFLKAYIAEVNHAIKSGKLEKSDFLSAANEMRASVKATDKQAWKSLWDKEWTSIEQAEQALAATTFEVRGGNFFGWSPDKVGSNKGAKIGRDDLVAKGFPNISDMVRLMEDPRFDGIPAGHIVGAVQFEKGQQQHSTASDLGVNEHLSYPVISKGKGMGFFEKPIDALSVLKTDKEGHNAYRSAETSMAGVTFSVKLKGNELGSSDSVVELKKKAKEYLRSLRGESVEQKETGAMIRFDKTGEEKSISGKRKKEELQVLAGIKDLIANSTFLGTRPDAKNNAGIKSWMYYESKAEIDGTPHNYLIIVREAHDGQRFYETYTQKDGLGATKGGSVSSKEETEYPPAPSPVDSVESSGQNVNPTYSIRSAEDRQKFQDELDKRIHSDPEVYIPIWEKMREKVKQVQDTIDAFSRADSRDVTGTLQEKYREQGLIEINAVINALPKEIRSEFIRNWRNPYSGEQGNIFTKYSSLTTDAERTDMLVKTVRKAKEALDDALVNDFSTRHQKLLDKSAPKMKAGEKPKGKLGADTHAILADIQRYSHMDLAEVDSHVQSLQAEKDKLENGEGTIDEDARQAKIDKLDTQIWLANTHGGMSMTDSDGKLKTAELRRSDVDRMGSAVEELKDIIQNGRFEFNAEKKARSDQNKAIRQQVMDIVNGGKKGTPTSVQSARDKDASGKATPSKRTDNLLLPTQLFRQILKNSPLGDEWVQRLNKAQNDEADANIKFQHDAIQTLREKWGKNGKPASTLEVQKIISELSTTLKKTGIKIRPNNVYKVRTIDRGELDNYKGLITDREYNNLIRVLSDPDNSKIKRIDIHELTEESPEEELLLSPLQFVDALTAAEQPDSIQKVERNGLTPDVVAKIRDLVMKSKAKDVYDLAKQAYDNYDRINSVFRRLYGVDLPRVENYAPLTFDTSEPEKIIDMDDGQAGGASSQPSWTKSRGNFGGILRYDNSWAKLQNHMMNVNYWVSHAETLRDFRAIFGDTQVLRSIGSQNANHSEFLKNYMKVLSRDKQTNQNMSNQDMHLKKMFASVMSVATLGGSIPTAAKHINVGLAPLSEISLPQYILSALRVGTGLAPRNAFFGGNAMIKDKVVSRFADASHSETGADALQAAREWSSPFMQGAALTGQQIAKMSMVPLHATVNVSAAWSGAVRYDAAFTEAQGLGMSDAQAHSYAQQQVDQMLHERMNPTFRGDKPISGWGRVGPDWMQLYAGPAQQALASVINLYRGAKIDSEGKSALEAAGIKADRYGKILATWAASGAVEWLVKTAYTMICGSDQQKEEAENWKELVASLATGPIYGVPIIGPFASGSLKAAITGHNPFYAAGNPLSDMARGGYHIYQHMKNDEMTGKDYADMVKDVSIVAAWSLSYAFQKDLLAKGLSGVAAWSNTGKAVAGVVDNAQE